MAMHSASASRLVRAGAALLLLALTLAACGADIQPTPTAPPPLLEPDPTPTPEPAAPPASTGPWRTDIPIGAAHGDRAPNSALTLSNGSTATLESAAAGRAVLLYFFATW